MRAAGLVTSRGLEVALHPHAATHIESEEETEQLLERTPGLGLCIDTGHSSSAAATRSRSRGAMSTGSATCT